MHGAKPYNAIISFPRSGTDFFCSALVADRRIRYFREYFNPICNKRRDAALSTAFGDERILYYLKIMNEIDQAAFDRVMAETWLRDGYNTTKENFSATKFVQFLAHFNVVVLTRRLYHTFPTSRPDYILPILNGFMLAGEYRTLAQRRELNELRRWLATEVAVTGTHQAGILAYLVQHFVLLFEAGRSSTPLLAYEDIMQAGDDALAGTLAPIAAFGADREKVAKALAKARRKKGVDLAARRARFFRECPREWYEPVLKFLLEMSPDLAGSFARYVFNPREAL